MPGRARGTLRRSNSRAYESRIRGPIAGRLARVQKSVESARTERFGAFPGVACRSPGEGTEKATARAHLGLDRLGHGLANDDTVRGADRAAPPRQQPTTGSGAAFPNISTRRCPGRASAHALRPITRKQRLILDVGEANGLAGPAAGAPSLWRERARVDSTAGATWMVGLSSTGRSRPNTTQLPANAGATARAGPTSTPKKETSPPRATSRRPLGSRHPLGSPA